MPSQAAAASELLTVRQALYIAIASLPGEGTASVTPQSLGCPGPTGAQPNAPWRMFMRCATHQGWTEVLGQATQPGIRWLFSGPPGTTLPAGSTAPVVAADGTIYVAMQGSPVCSPAGAVLWSVVVTEATSLAIGGDGTLYAGTLQATLVALK